MGYLPIIRRLLRANKATFLPMFEKVQVLSVKAAAEEQGLTELKAQLCRVVPDIGDQYTTFKIDSEVLSERTRTLHAFQVSLTLEAVTKLSSRKKQLTIVDIGDSAGTHVQYLKALLNEHSNRIIQSLSVNLDVEAVERIRRKGLEALLCRAEQLHEYGIKADLFLSFEMLEHLSDPVSFLRTMSYEAHCDFFVVTVPYLAQSRVGLHHIRQNKAIDVAPENTHIFELSPSDWRLIFQHSGWHVVDHRVYLQYPRCSWLRIMQLIWKFFDYEGFYGAILTKDHTWSERYRADTDGTRRQEK